MKIKAHAKINLTLDILGKREDGFHELESVMQQLDLADDITIVDLPNKKITIECTGIPKKKNLVFKSVIFMRNKFKVEKGVKITIKKNIPVAAGLGGGSADAAAVIKGLNKLWKLGLSEEEMVDFASDIGSDVPFSIMGGVAVAKGRGEKLHKIDGMPSFDVVVINPGFGIRTKEGYLNLDKKNYGQKRATVKMLKDLSRDNIALNLHNDFEHSIFKKYPDLKEIKEELERQGADAAIMSGSGSSVFGIFKDKEEAKEAYDKLKGKYKFAFLTKTI